MKILIFGNGGHARVVASMAALGADCEPLGFIFSGVVAHATRMAGLPVYSEMTMADIPHDGLVIALGDIGQRRTVFRKYVEQGEAMTTVIHPSAIIAPDVVIEPGCMICAGVIVNPGCHIESNVVLNTGCTVDHDCTIGAHSHVAPGVNLAGNVAVGESVFIGIGASVVQDITLGADSMVGAGAVVIRNVPTGSTVVGIPAQDVVK